MIDTHTHLNFEAFIQDWREVVERAAAAGVNKMIVVGTDIESSRRAVEMAESHPALFAAVGIHPHHARQIENGELKMENTIGEIEKLAGHPRVVAIGEIGLDYHIYKNSKYPSTPSTKLRTSALRTSPELVNLQKGLLGMQVEIAKKLDKPLIVHSREAGEDVLDTIEHFAKSDGVMPKGVFHCFDGSKKYAQKILEAGLCISFTGNVTFVPDRAEVAKYVPLERLLLETDCPFMPPYAKASGGKTPRCEPKDVVEIMQFHADQRKVDIKEVVRQTSANAKKLFKL